MAPRSRPAVAPPPLKTAPCISFSRTGRCTFGAACRYAHGKAELRPPPKFASDSVHSRAVHSLFREAVHVARESGTPAAYDAALDMLRPSVALDEAREAASVLLSELAELLLAAGRLEEAEARAEEGVALGATPEEAALRRHRAVARARRAEAAGGDARRRPCWTAVLSRSARAPRSASTSPTSTCALSTLSSESRRPPRRRPPLAPPSP